MPLFKPNVDKLRAKGNVKGLIKALGYEKDAVVQREAVNALVDIGSEAVGPLVNLLYEYKPAYWASAIHALLMIGDAAIEPLATAMGDGNAQAPALVKILVQYGDVAAFQLTKAMRDAFLTERLGLARKYAAVLDTLSWQPGDDEVAAIYWIIGTNWEQCVGLGSSAVDPLIHVLRGPDADLRVDAAEALGRISDARAVPSLAQALLDEDVYVRMRASVALRSFDEECAVEPLVHVLHHGRQIQGRNYAIELLGQLGNERAVEPLVLALKNLGKLRESAAKALLEIGCLSAVDSLIELLSDANQDVRRTSARLLADSYRSASSKESWGRHLRDHTMAIQRLLHNDSLVHFDQTHNVHEDDNWCYSQRKKVLEHADSRSHRDVDTDITF